MSGWTSKGEGLSMVSDQPEEFAEKLVSYAIEVGNRFVVVENVPARISLRTGERLFTPAVVERLQDIVREPRVPIRVIQTPVFEFTDSLV
jgi:hypothetical protein